MQLKFWAFEIWGKILAMNSGENNEDLEQEFMKNEKMIDATSIIFFLTYTQDIIAIQQLSQFTNLLYKNLQLDVIL